MIGRVVVVLWVVLSSAPWPWEVRIAVSDIVSNGGFEADLTGWSVTNTAHEDDLYFETQGSAHMNAAAGAATLTQAFVQPPGDAGTYYLYRLVFHVYTEAALSDQFQVNLFVVAGDTYFTDTWEDELTPDQWHTFEFYVWMEGHTAAQLSFTLNNGAGAVYVDDVALLEEVPTTGTCRELAWELAKRRSDWAMMKHPPARYEEAINRAIREAPRRLWRLDVDTSVTTIDETRRYSLAAITAITDYRQVRRMFLEDSNEHYLQMGQWRLEDDLGTLTLVLDDDPPDEDRTIRLEYIRPHDELDCEDDDDVTTLDREWLLAKAMTILLTEAADFEDPALVARDLQIWDSVRIAREANVQGRRRPGKLRSRAGGW